MRLFGLNAIRLLAGLSTVYTLGTAQAVDIVAHRGYSELAPENTVAAYKLAYEHTTNTECDIRLTADNRLMLMHDASTSRTTGVDLLVSATQSSRLRELDAGSWKDAKYAGEKIPFLEEVLDTIPVGGRMYVEIKSSTDTVAVLKQVLDKSGKIDQVTIIAFDIDVCGEAKEQMPNVPVLFLKSAKKNKKTEEVFPFDPAIIKAAQDRKLDGLDLDHKGVDADIIRLIRDAKMYAAVWTVDSPREARRLRDLGVDSITTNDPVVIRQALQDGTAR